MLKLNQMQSRLRPRMSFLKSRYQVTSLAVFGSFVSGRPHKKSDVDNLIDFKKNPDLFEFLQVEAYLENILGRRVDLVRSAALRKELSWVANEAVNI